MSKKSLIHFQIFINPLLSICEKFKMLSNNLLYCFLQWFNGKFFLSKRQKIVVYRYTGGYFTLKLVMNLAHISHLHVNIHGLHGQLIFFGEKKGVGCKGPPEKYVRKNIRNSSPHSLCTIRFMLYPPFHPVSAHNSVNID